MEQTRKRQKITKESLVDDIASSISEISNSVTSMSEKYRTLLKVNRAVVRYYQNIKDCTGESNIQQVLSNLEETRIDSE